MVGLARPPYTPWRDGPPRFAVSLKPIDPGAWLIPDTEAASLPERRRLLANRTLASFESAGAVAAAGEAVRLAATHLRDTGFDVPEPEAGAPALWQLAHHVSDDLVLMMPDDDGWRVGAAVLTSPTFFSLPHAAGKTLAELHAPVPGGDRLAARILEPFPVDRQHRRDAAKDLGVGDDVKCFVDGCLHVSLLWMRLSVIV